ncbi:AMP-dependent ligase [Chondromyces crocatus]|uniref:AMP-dependent ligase n=2 Tax=Chondromyces crocatus TaxID=52 RepID=A0A0K1EQL4_CHOCO|nr:AMP-dependent ligase [Chondromyces crocatus]
MREVLGGAQARARFAVWKARTASRVVVQTGLHTAMHWRGARCLVSELLRGKSGPSSIFKFHAENTPDAVALVDARSFSEAGGEDRTYSFRVLDDAIDRLGSVLHGWGIGPGRGALVMLKNRAEFLVVQPAVSRIGAAAVSASWRSTVPELVYLASHSGAGALFFDAELAGLIEEAAPQLSGIARERMIAVGGAVPGFRSLDDVVAGAEGGGAPDRSEAGSVVMYTSGTTGKPKGAVRTFPKDAAAATLAFIGETPMHVGDTHLVVCPLYHATAFAFASMNFVVGAKVVVLREFKPELFMEALQRYRVTSTAVVPTMLHRVMELGKERLRQYDTSSLRMIVAGGAPLPAQLATEVLGAFGDKLYNFYGATEVGLVTLAKPADLHAAPATIGKAVPGVEIRLIHESGRDCAIGEVGELYARSLLLIEGYHRDPEATREATLDGFFTVGDLARRDADGRYFIEGRKRDMIISGGVNVYPAEVEAALHEHPDVAEAAVVGVADREWGERVRAFVVRRPGTEVTEESLKEHCRVRVARPKVPREVVFLDELPRNPTGKVLKRELVRWEAT